MRGFMGWRFTAWRSYSGREAGTIPTVRRKFQRRLARIETATQKEQVEFGAGGSLKPYNHNGQFINSPKARAGSVEGNPLDQNIYQAVKGMTAAEAVVRENGVIIIAAKAQDGHGGDGFYSTFGKEKDLRRMLECFISTPPDQTVVDQWQSQIFARVLCRAAVIFISDVPDEMVENFQMIPAHSMEQAIEAARQILGKDRWDTVVIPDGVSVIVSVE